MFSKTDIEQYFSAEKQGSVFFLAVGVVAVIAAVILFFVLKTPFFKGAAIPMIVVGLIAGGIGFTIYVVCNVPRLVEFIAKIRRMVKYC